MKSTKSAHGDKQIIKEYVTSKDRRKESGGLGYGGSCEGADDECAEILHGLNNVLASMLLNAQVMEWKLPSYSRSRRYLHEIERNAQRGGELVKRLLARLDSGRRAGVSHCRPGAEIPSLAEEDGLVTHREAEVTAKPDALPLDPKVCPSPACAAPQ